MHDFHMINSCKIAAIFVCIGLAACAGPDTFGSQIELSGAYHFSYATPDGTMVEDVTSSTVFDDPTTSGACCLAVFRTGDVLTIRVGSWMTAPTYPDPATGACPAVAGSDIVIDGIGEGAQVLDARAGAATMFYQRATLDANAPADPCPRSVYTAGSSQLTEPITLAGQIEIDRLACAGGESPAGDCALQATGSWAIAGVDQITGSAVLFTSGSFTADDQRL